MDISGGYAKSTSTDYAKVTQTQKPTFVGAVDLADEAVRDLQSRIERLADRLVGATPKAISDSEGSSGVGVFESVYSVAARTAARARASMDDLDRIENALP